MHVIKLSGLLQLLPMVTVTQAIIIDPVSLASWPHLMQGPLRICIIQAFNLAFTQTSAGSVQLNHNNVGPISDLGTWLFSANGKPVVTYKFNAIRYINQYFTSDKTTPDYGNNPIVYTNLDRFIPTCRPDGALWDRDARVFAGGDPAVIQACRTGEGAQPPHFLAFNYGPRAIHDTIDICPWYIQWLSQVGIFPSLLTKVRHEVI